MFAFQQQPTFQPSLQQRGSPAQNNNLTLPPFLPLANPDNSPQTVILGNTSTPSAASIKQLIQSNIHNNNNNNNNTQQQQQPISVFSHSLLQQEHYLHQQKQQQQPLQLLQLQQQIELLNQQQQQLIQSKQSQLSQQPLIHNLQQMLQLNQQVFAQQHQQQQYLIEQILPITQQNQSQQQQSQQQLQFQPLFSQVAPPALQSSSSTMTTSSQSIPSSQNSLTNINLTFGKQLEFPSTISSSNFQSILLPFKATASASSAPTTSLISRCVLPTESTTCQIRAINQQNINNTFFNNYSTEIEVISSTGFSGSNHNLNNKNNINNNNSNNSLGNNNNRAAGSMNEYENGNQSQPLIAINDTDSYDSFFQPPGTHRAGTNNNRNTTMSGKSFFLVSNYKKRLLSSLDSKDQAILVGMKKSKKFNFSKNVIKQFLKSMGTEIAYKYEVAPAPQNVNATASESSSRVTYFAKNMTPLNSDLCTLREQLKSYLACNTYTHSSIKKLITHNYYALYFRDFLEHHTEEWIESGKTKYKQEQTVMIEFLKLCMRNRKLLIFLSEHDPTKHLTPKQSNSAKQQNNTNNQYAEVEIEESGTQ